MKSENKYYIKEQEILLYKRNWQMDDQRNSVLFELLDTNTNFNYLN